MSTTNNLTHEQLELLLQQKDQQIGELRAYALYKEKEAADYLESLLFYKDEVVALRAWLKNDEGYTLSEIMAAVIKHKAQWKQPARPISLGPKLQEKMK